MTLEVDIQKSQRNWRATISSKLADIVAALPSALLTTRGDLITRDGSAPMRLALGAADTFLHSDGTDPGWSVPILSKLSNVLGADVALNNTANFFTGPTVAQGTSGIWLAMGTVTLNDTASTANFVLRLTDGTTIAASAATQNRAPTAPVTASLVGIFTNPAGNIRINVKGSSSTTSAIKFNQSGDSKDSSIWAVRIG